MRSSCLRGSKIFFIPRRRVRDLRSGSDARSATRLPLGEEHVRAASPLGIRLNIEKWRPDVISGIYTFQELLEHVILQAALKGEVYYYQNMLPR